MALEKASLAETEQRSWERGGAPAQPCFPLKGAPVRWLCPQVPGRLMFTGLAWAVCQHQDQTEICCSTSQALPWRLATPQRPVCEGRKEAGPFSLPRSRALSPRLLGWVQTGRDRRHTGRPYTTKQGLPHGRGLQPPPQWPATTRQGVLLLLLWLVGLLGRECSLCSQTCKDDLCMWTEFAQTHAHCSICSQVGGALGEFFPLSTWHSVNVAIMLFV